MKLFPYIRSSTVVSDGLNVSVIFGVLLIPVMIYLWLQWVNAPTQVSKEFAIPTQGITPTRESDSPVSIFLNETPLKVITLTPAQSLTPTKINPVNGKDTVTPNYAATELLTLSSLYNKLTKTPTITATARPNVWIATSVPAIIVEVTVEKFIPVTVVVEHPVPVPTTIYFPVTVTPSPAPTMTLTPTETLVPEITSEVTESVTPTDTPTFTVTPTVTDLPTSTISPTETMTETSTLDIVSSSN